MTNILLSIIAVLLFARIVLQIRQGKRAVEKGYAAPSEVRNTFRHVQGDTFAIRSTLNAMSQNRWGIGKRLCWRRRHLTTLFHQKENQKTTTTDYGSIYSTTAKRTFMPFQHGCRYRYALQYDRGGLYHRGSDGTIWAQP